MLTVMVGFDGSGNSSTRRPFASRYSVMPSTEVTRSGAGAAIGAGGGGAGLGFFASQTGASSAAQITIDAWKRGFDGMGHSLHLSEGARLYPNDR